MAGGCQSGRSRPRYQFESGLVASEPTTAQAATAAPAGECAPVATIVLQPTTVSAASPPACAGGFAVSVVNGTRYAEKKAGDLPARGILIVAAPKR